MAKKDLPTPEDLRKVLRYEPETGKLFWLRRECKRFNANFAGKEAFTALSDGYRISNVGGRMLKAHRVAWAMHYGSWPVGFLDHRDRNPSNNRISNLRKATAAENSQNVSSAKDASSKFLGVYWDSNRSKWAATIKVNGKSKGLGRFSCETKAAISYDLAAAKSFGNYASLNFPRTNV